MNCVWACACVVCVFCDYRCGFAFVLVLSFRRQDQAHAPIMNFGYRFRPGPWFLIGLFLIKFEGLFCELVLVCLCVWRLRHLVVNCVWVCACVVLRFL